MSKQLLFNTDTEILDWIKKQKIFKKYTSKIEWNSVKETFIIEKSKSFISLYNKINDIKSIRRIEACLKIVSAKNFNNIADYFTVFDNYYNTINVFEKQKILYGEEKVIELKNICSNTGKQNTLKYGAVNSIDRYLNKGYSEEEAKRIVSDVAKRGGAKISETAKRNKEQKKYKKNSINYYTKIGYSEEEAKQILKEKYAKSFFVLNKDSFIRRYGDTLGKEKYYEMLAKRVSTKKKKYGTAYCTVRISNESWLVLNDILEYIKANNILYYGLDKKEYFIMHENDIFFYDLTLPEKKIIIEYNNSFWHPNNPYKENARFSILLDKDACAQKDKFKIKLAEANGFKVFVIWDNEPNLCDKIKEIITYAERS